MLVMGEDVVGVVTRDDVAAAVESMGMGHVRWTRPTVDLPDGR